MPVGGPMRGRGFAGRLPMRRGGRFRGGPAGRGGPLSRGGGRGGMLRGRGWLYLNLHHILLRTVSYCDSALKSFTFC